MLEDFDLHRILAAAIFATCKHQRQVRKDARQSPYVTHPLQVAQILWEVGGVRDVKTLIAAVLHDTIEDTPTTQAEVREDFGEEVLQIVLEVTDDKSLEKMTRKHMQVIHAPQLSQPARLIKLGDKLVNCRDILQNPPKNWSLDRRRNYIQWGADVIAKIRGTNTALEEAFDQVLCDAQAQLKFSIKSFKTINDRPWGPSPSSEE
jgi:GTP diphosphokinase / guanosine-3',5'-bis(diphosphate) 3'-diphosphatase